MNEGGMIKMYVEKQRIREGEVAAVLGVSEAELPTIYESQTVAPDVKEKLETLFKRDIFDGSLLTEYAGETPDQNANRE